jgi:hypothetical protein
VDLKERLHGQDAAGVSEAGNSERGAAASGIRGVASEEANKVIIPVLTEMYWLLNQRLAQIAQKMRYGLDQDQWLGCKPRGEMAKEMPGISATQWYQIHLGEIMIKSAQPWAMLIAT